jgi:hypothetical protein
MTRRLVGMLLASLRSAHTKDVEIAVLRHQLSVLRRQLKPAEFRPADRTLLAALGGVLRRGLDGLAGHRPVAAAPGGREAAAGRGQSPDAEPRQQHG